MSSNVLSEELLRKIPKAELHMHLDGCIRPSTVLDLAKEQGVKLPTEDLDELTSMIEVGEDCPSLVEYLRAFEIVNLVTQKAYALTRVMYEVCEDCANDGVSYVEVRFAPVLHTREKLNLSAVMEAVVEGAVVAEMRLPIVVRIIVCGLRHLDPEVTAQMAEIAWRYRHRGVVGFDLAGPEDGFTSENHKHAFDIVRKNCLNVTLHAGENAGYESIHDSLRYCGTQRVGHGTRLLQSEELLEFVVDRQIVIECCITSNYQTKATTSLDSHPIKRFLDAGVWATLCTDNKTMSRVTLSKEYAIASDLYKLSLQEILTLIDNGFRAAFVDPTTRFRLRVAAWKKSLSVLREAGYNVAGLVGELTQQPHLALRTLSINSSERYWEGHEDPEITLQCVQELPKTDLHCRFHGSVSLEALLREMALLSDEEREALSIPHDVESQRRLLSECSTDAAVKCLKRWQYELLQTKQQLERGVEDILRVAVSESVICTQRIPAPLQRIPRYHMELMVRPGGHTTKGLSEKEVLETILTKKRELEKTLPITVNVVVYCDITDRDACLFNQHAHFFVEAAKQHRDVIGFGVFGADLQAHEYKYFTCTFSYLKDQNAKVVINAGRDSASAVIEALHAGGAGRLSGAFHVHHEPTLMQYLANRSVPVEIADSVLLNSKTADVRSFAHPIRLFLDHQIRIVVCSFRNSRVLGAESAHYRSQHLLQLVRNANLRMADVFRLLGNGFEYSLAHFRERQKLFQAFWAGASKVAAAQGFKHLKAKAWFPAE